jgi:two-component system nitrogen regulation sensor histidine kinase NtrY
MEEHGGGIELNDAPGGRGAWIRLRIRHDGRPEGAPAAAAPSTAGRA